MRQYEQGERFIRAVEASGGPDAAGPGVGGPRDAPHHGRDPPPRDVGGAHRTGPARHRLMRPGPPPTVTPRTAPTAGTAPSPALHVPGRRCARSSCAVSGGPIPWPCWCWPSAAGCDGDRRPRRPRAAARARRGEADVVAAAAAPLRCPLPGACGWRWSPARTSKPGPAPPAAPRCPPGRPPATPWTTRPRRCCSTSCGAPGLDGLAGHAPRARHPLLGLRRAETHALCGALGPRPGARPLQRRPPLRAQPRPPRAPAAGRGHRRARPGPGAGPPGDAAGRRSRPARRAGGGHRPHRRRRAGAAPSGRWPAGPPGAGCVAAPPIPPTWPPWSGSWPWPGGRWAATDVAPGCGCGARGAGCRRRRSRRAPSGSVGAR